MPASSAKDRAYSVIPYQKSWIADFETIKNQISPIFEDRAIEIVHVGSTAIVGMSGKPTIDVLVIVNDISRIDDLNTTMAELGYVALGEYVTSSSRLFAKEENNERLINIHCFEKDHPHAQEMIVMRDFLRSHPDEAKAYADLKIDLHRKYPDDYKAYRHFKDPYLTKMKARAIEWAGSSVRPDKNNLTTTVSAFRSVIEPYWSEDSAYKVPEIQNYGAHISGGQCAVTCLVLMDVLREKLPDEQIFLVSGQLQSTNGEVVIRNHGWLRIGSGTDAIIVDPTADQATSISEKVVIGTASELEKQELHYIEKEVEADHGELVHPKRFKRYMILKNAWNKRDVQIHEMKLVSRQFDDILNGTKQYEIRLNDEKRQKIKIGDRIIFQKLPDLAHSITVEVTSLTSYSNFSSMYDSLKSEYPDWKKSDWIKAMYAYYTPADEHSYGTLAIGIKLV